MIKTFEYHDNYLFLDLKSLKIIKGIKLNKINILGKIEEYGSFEIIIKDYIIFSYPIKEILKDNNILYKCNYDVLPIKDLFLVNVYIKIHLIGDIKEAYLEYENTNYTNQIIYNVNNLNYYQINSNEILKYNNYNLVNEILILNNLKEIKEIKIFHNWILTDNYSFIDGKIKFNSIINLKEYQIQINLHSNEIKKILFAHLEPNKLYICNGYGYLVNLLSYIPSFYQNNIYNSYNTIDYIEYLINNY